MTDRNKLIQLIHIGAAKLFNDDDARRSWQMQHTGKTSCKDMTNEQLNTLVKVLRKSKAIDPPKRAGRVPFNTSPYMEKIEAQLADMGLSWQYAETIAYHVTGGRGRRYQGPGVQRLEWVRERKHFEAIIAALETEQRKRAGLDIVTSLLNELGQDETYIEKMLAGHKNAAKWQRNLDLLYLIYDRLSAELRAIRQGSMG